MATSILNGDMSGSITNGTIVDIREMKNNVFVRAQWPATGAPNGFIGLKLGATRDRLEDVGYLDGVNFDSNGAQPTGAAGSIAVDFQTGAHYAQAYYAHGSGGTGNTGLIVDIDGK